MKNMTTLNNFIDEQLTNFKIPDTEKNKKKLRTKFMRELKELGHWNKNNPTILVEKSQTKVFTDEQLKDLYKRVEPYLIKRSPLDFDAISKQKEKNKDYLDNPISYITPEDDKNTILIPPVEIPKNQKIEVMIEALFYQQFELNEELWLKDLKTIDDPFEDHHLNQELLTSNSFILAQLRTKNPLQSYVKKRLD